MAAPSNRLLSTQNPKSIGFMWVFAVLWCGVSFPVFWMFAIQMRQVAPGIVGGLFAAFGLVMLFFTVRATLEYVKFGQVDLTLDGEPAVGRGFGAMVRLPASPALAKLTAELACVQLIPDRDAKGEPTTREADAWTLKQEFPVRRGAAGAYATLRFDVPADQPATTTAEDIGLDEAQMKEAFKDLDLAKFRALHAAAARAQARGSYRWELRIRADVPGIDLDRTFNLSMAPAPAGTVAQPATGRPAAGKPAARGIDPAVEARAAERSSANRKLKVFCFIVAIVVGLFLHQFGVVDFRGATNWARAKLGFPVPGAPVAGFDAQAEKPRHVAIAARGIAVESDGAALSVRVQELRLEKLPRSAQRYEQLGAVVYRAGDWPGRSFGYAWQEVRGELTRDEPVAALANRVFQFGGVGERCADGGCEVRFFAVVDTGSGTTTQDRTEGYRLARIVPVAAVAQPAAPARRGPDAWAPHFAAAMEAFSGGSDADAERLLRDALAVIEKQRGEGHPAAARVHYQLSLLHERRKQPAEQEKALIAARQILFNLPDKVVKEDLAPDVPVDLEMITRRLADFYREQRRYQDADVHYRRAQQYLSQIELSAPERNERFARGAVGLLATACAQSSWNAANHELTEAKARIAGVADAGARQELEQAVRSIEPRLAARKC